MEWRQRHEKGNETVFVEHSPGDAYYSKEGKIMAALREFSTTVDIWLRNDVEEDSDFSTFWKLLILIFFDSI